DDARALFGVGPGFCVRRASQQIWCWGGDQLGALPKRVRAFEDGEVMSGEGPFSCVKKSSGPIECWGLNWDAQLGNGSLTDSAKPTSVLGWPGGQDAPRSTGAPFSVSIEQRGAIQKVDGHTVHLLREPFTIVIEFRSDVSRVFVNASHARATFDAALA